MNILVVDDLEFVRTYVKKAIEYKYNFKTLEASCCNSALEMIQNNSFDIIISDCELPDGNGQKICSKATLANPETFFIFMAGMQINDESDSKKLYLRKPFHTQELYFTMDKILIRTPRAPRYQSSKEIEIRVYDITVGKAEIINVSRSGALLRSANGLPKIFQIKIESRINPWCEIVRKYKHQNLNYYGVRFSTMIDDMTLKYLTQPQ